MKLICFIAAIVLAILAVLLHLFAKSFGVDDMLAMGLVSLALEEAGHIVP